MHRFAKDVLRWCHSSHRCHRRRDGRRRGARLWARPQRVLVGRRVPLGTALTTVLGPEREAPGLLPDDPQRRPRGYLEAFHIMSIF